MSWLEEAENSNQAYQDAIQKFLNVRDRISKMKFEGLEVFPKGFSDFTYERGEEGEPISFKNEEYEYWGGEIPMKAPAFGCGSYRGTGKYIKETRIFINEEKGNHYSINFVSLEYGTWCRDGSSKLLYQHNYRPADEYKKVIVTQEELSNIPEDVWVTLFGWSVRKTKTVPFEALTNYVESAPIDVFAESKKAHLQNNPPKKAKSGGCYIATACYGSYDAEEVIVFRKFRDDVLLKSTLGNYFVAIYYKYSPYLAQKLKNMPKINHFVRRFVLDSIYKRLIMRK